MAAAPAAEASFDDGLHIPLIDFSPFTNDGASTTPSKSATASAIFSAFQASGFLYLRNHGIPPLTLSTVYEHSASFFRRPTVQKKSLLWTTPEANRGYSAPGREKASRSTDKSEVEALRVGNPDLKESFEIGLDDDVDHPNRWPDAMDEGDKEFKAVMLRFFKACQSLNMLVMSAIALGMGLDEGFFDGFIDKGNNTLRLLHYPPVKREVFMKNRGQVRVGEHSDYGSITLLFQDGQGGLQIRGLDGAHVHVKPIEGAVIVNAGDLLARWSNDQIKSTLHRVVEPPKPETTCEGTDAQMEYPARYSIAYFCNPNFDAFIDAIPGTFDGDLVPKRYSKVTSGDYLVQRLRATY
ncbi:MAG: hypothetical protein M1814_003064 [Vezdaea aestivalis]|nr:MAG: hypothetical protein M1814_003064 [Vezdaea aestivalis]